VSTLLDPMDSELRNPPPLQFTLAQDKITTASIQLNNMNERKEKATREVRLACAPQPSVWRFQLCCRCLLCSCVAV